MYVLRYSTKLFLGGGIMRKDIFEVIFMAKKNDSKINFAEIARQYGCDPRTVKRYFNARDQNPLVRKSRKLNKVTDGFEELIKDKYINHHAPAIAIFNLLKLNYGYKGSYTSIKTFTHQLKKRWLAKLH